MNIYSLRNNRRELCSLGWDRHQRDKLLLWTVVNLVRHCFIVLFDCGFLESLCYLNTYVKIQYGLWIKLFSTFTFATFSNLHDLQKYPNDNSVVLYSSNSSKLCQVMPLQVTISHEMIYKFTCMKRVKINSLRKQRQIATRYGLCLLPVQDR